VAIVHIGNKIIQQTIVEIFTVKKLSECRLLNAGDTIIYLDFSKDNLNSAEGGYSLAPGKELFLKDLEDITLYAVLKDAGQARLTWFLIPEKA